MRVCLHAENTALVWASELPPELANALGKRAEQIVHNGSKVELLAAFSKARQSGTPQYVVVQSKSRHIYAATIYPAELDGTFWFVCVSEEVPHVANELTAKERVVCRLLGEGLEVEQIANLLKLARNTVATHRHNAQTKLRLRGNKFLAWCAEHKRVL